MRLDEFRERVFAEFGADLHRATPENVTVFLATMDWEEEANRHAGPVELHPGENSYERIIKDFLAAMLAESPSDAVVPLWKFACQLAFSMVEQHETARLPHLAEE